MPAGAGRTRAAIAINLGGQTGRERVNRHGQLCGKRKCDFGSTVFARRENLFAARSAFIDTSGKAPLMLKPGVLGPVIALELTVSSDCRSASVPGIPSSHKSRL